MVSQTMEAFPPIICNGCTFRIETKLLDPRDPITNEGVVF